MTNIADMLMSSRDIDMEKTPKAGAESAIDWLRLSAAPAVAIMALLTGVFGGGQMPMADSTDASFLTGMVPMYLLMSVFHATPWLKRVAGR
jgi:hypothetical protein